MTANSIADWDDAYSNAAHIPDGPSYAGRWTTQAAEFREGLRSSTPRMRLDIPYGEHGRNCFDLFLPEENPRGLVVFVHGGYFIATDKSTWSHLASGTLAHGYAVAMPSYVLCPEATIPDIGRQVAAAITAAAGEITGPIHLAGHSAGGHLVARMITSTTPLDAAILARVRKTVSISGLHDLRPLRNTKMNDLLKLDAETARSESVALLDPMPGMDLTCWVGAAERPEFLRQNALPQNLWSSFDIRVSSVEEAGRHHYNVIDGLTDPEHRLVRTLLRL
ncbi:MAG: alpha/beta hydrolase [Pseudaminobacter sp.]